MQPDYRYLNSAIYTNMGIYNGDVTADAQYDWDLFSPTAGNYLPKNSTTITQCTSGNFCIGATNIHYDADNDQGITSCSTLGDNSYTQSAIGSSTDTQCYKNCSTTDIANSTKVSGNDYYGGSNNDTCTATACDGGYTVSSGSCNANTLNITWTGLDNETVSNANAGTCTYGGAINVPPAPPHIPGKRFVGWKIQLPYTPIEYLEFCSTCYINTQKQLGANFEIYATVMLLELVSGSGHCVLNGNGRSSFSVLSYSDTLFASIIDEQYLNGGIGIPGDNIKFTFGISPEWMQNYNGTRKILSRPYSRNDPLFIGGKGSSGVPTYLMRVYNVKMYNNGVLDLDAIPVKDSNGVPCMYDRINKRFLYNSGSGSLTAGPEI